MSSNGRNIVLNWQWRKIRTTQWRVNDSLWWWWRRLQGPRERGGYFSGIHFFSLLKISILSTAFNVLTPFWHNSLSWEQITFLTKLGRCQNLWTKITDLFNYKWRNFKYISNHASLFFPFESLTDFIYRKLIYNLCPTRSNLKWKEIFVQIS